MKQETCGFRHEDKWCIAERDHDFAHLMLGPSSDGVTTTLPLDTSAEQIESEVTDETAACRYVVEVLEPGGVTTTRTIDAETMTITDGVCHFWDEAGREVDSVIASHVKSLGV
jgi:hypothetical protein